MNAAKNEIIDIINQMPDDLDKNELLNRLYVETRLEQSREDFRQNGGYADTEVRKAMRDRYNAMIEGNV